MSKIKIERIKYLVLTIKEFSFKSIGSKGILNFIFLCSFFIILDGVAMTIKEIKKATKGKGVFSVAVTNNNKHDKVVCVSVQITNPPPGCEFLRFAHGRPLGIGANETATIELSVPLVSPKGRDDIEQYEDTDNLLPLPEDSEVVIKVKMPGAGRAKLCGYSLPQYRKSFKAKYLPGTRLVELPQEVSITIGINQQQAPDKPTPQLVKDVVSNMFS